MNLEYKYLLDAGFHPTSRVWVYQSNRLFSLSEAFEVEEMLNDFTKNWQSHGAPIKGAAWLFFGQFIILMADELQRRQWVQYRYLCQADQGYGKNLASACLTG